MKKLIFLLCLISFLQSNAQSNIEIAGVYIKRANESLNNFDVEIAKSHFEKATKYMDSINTPEVARLGTFIYYKLKLYEEAKKFAGYYFNLVNNKKSEEYTEMLTLSVDLNEFLDEIQLEKKRIEEEKIRKKTEHRKMDSLKAIWTKKAALLSIKVDTIYNFNSNNIALFKKKDFFGLLNDVGKILIEADEYKDVVSFDGFFIFKNAIKNPTKLYCYNSKDNLGFLIPNVSDFNMLSTNYGVVMFPRANGKLVTYPNNANEVFVFDLYERKILKISDKEIVLKNLKKADFIDKFNDDGEVKIGKEWYYFGGHLGGGIHPMYAKEGYNLQGFLHSINGRFSTAKSDFDFIGAFHNDNAQAIKDGQNYWIDQKGGLIEAENQTDSYNGNSIIVKLNTGAYQLKRDDLIILGNEKLEKMTDFMKKHAQK
jgi:hypothetical protein